MSVFVTMPMSRPSCENSICLRFCTERKKRAHAHEVTMTKTDGMEKRERTTYQFLEHAHDQLQRCVFPELKHDLLQQLRQIDHPTAVLTDPFWREERTSPIHRRVFCQQPLYSHQSAQTQLSQ